MSRKQQFETFEPQRASRRRNSSFARTVQEDEPVTETVTNDGLDAVLHRANSIRIKTPQKSAPKTRRRRQDNTSLDSESEDASSSSQKFSILSHPNDPRRKNPLLDASNYFKHEFHAPPLHWGINLGVTFRSPTSFSWCGGGVSTRMEARSRSDFIGQRSISTILGSEPLDLDLSMDRDQAMHALQIALMQWTFPVKRLDPRDQMLTLISQASMKKAPQWSDAEKRAIAGMTERRNLWEKSFRSLYYSCRNGDTEHFYYLDTQHAILFLRGATDDGDNEDEDYGVLKNGSRKRLRNDQKSCIMRAVICKTTAGFRDTLKECGVDIELPLWSEERTQPRRRRIPKYKKIKRAAGDDDDDEDYDAPEIFNGHDDLPSNLDGTSASLVVVSGRQMVHRLFDCLLNTKQLTNDVPMLHSPTIFAHASLQHLRIEKNAAVTRQGTASTEQEHLLSLSGPLFPSNMLKVLSVLRMTQDKGFEALLQPDTASGCAHLTALRCHRGENGLSQLCALSDEECSCLNEHTDMYRLITSSSKAQSKHVVKLINKIRLQDDVFQVGM